MTRRVFYSFHYEPDNWRVGRIRNIGAIEGNKPAADNDWEQVKKGGETAIKQWIAEQMKGRSCTVVLVGAKTAARKWINYEIEKSWEDRMGVVGIHIHGLEDRDKTTSRKGGNPFEFVSFGGRPLSAIVRCYDPTVYSSRLTYRRISDSLARWIEEAIRIRRGYRQSPAGR